MSQREIVLCGGKRTPFGDFGRSLRGVPASDLAVHAAKAAAADAGAALDGFDHLVCANVLPVDHDGLFLARVVALKAGLREDSAALGVSRACGSGVQAIVSAAEQILTGHSSLALAGGVESFSRAPFVAREARWGHARGPQVLDDALDFAYRDPFDGALMGETAEALSDDFGYARADMDAWGLMSQQRAGAAMRSGFLARQIAPLDVPDGKGTRCFAEDEFPRPQVTAEKLASLKAAFRAGGRVTAGNSSGITDGAAFVVVADRQAAERRGLRPRLRLVDWAVVGVPPRIMGSGPVPAIRALLSRTGLAVGDVDVWEINEAFAAVNLHAERQLGIPRERTNLYGGGISIGHPPGATGVRMALCVMHHLEDTQGRYGVVSMCLGAGQGMAALFERVA